MKKILLVIMAIILITIPAAAQDSMSAKDSLDYTIGTWETEYEYPGMGHMREEVTYTRGEDENTILVEVKVFNAEGEQIDSGNGWVKYDPEADTIKSMVNSKMMNEEYESHEIERSGNVVWMEGTGGQMMPLYRVKMIYTGKDSMDWAMYMPDGDDWKESLSVTYNRISK